MTQPLSRAMAWRGAAAGAVTTALVQMPFDAVYGIIAFAPLGHDFAAMAVASALIGTVAANIAASLAGSRQLVLGPRPAMTLLVAGLVAALLAHPAMHGADGAPQVPLLLGLVALALALSGVLQVGFGLLKLGSLTKYLPYPVRAGFMNGVGALLVLGGLRLIVGLPPRGDPTDLAEVVAVLRADLPWGTLLVGVVTLLATLRPPRWRRFALPGPLFGILAGIVAYQALALRVPAGALGATMSAPGTPALGAVFAADWSGFLHDAPLSGLSVLLLGFALAVAVLASLDTFLVASVMDGVTRRRRNGNRELMAQGWSNVAAGFVGGLPSAPAPMRSLLLYRTGGHSQWSIVLYAGLVAATLFLVPGLLALIPMSALGGALIVVGCQMADEWSRTTPRQLLVAARRNALRPRERGMLRDNYAVMLLVAATVVLRGVAEGVLVGVVAAMVLFVRSNARALVRRVARGDVRRSSRIRVPEADAHLRAVGARIALLELDGTIFFGTAEELADRVHTLARDSDYLILGMRRVGDIDSTGARTLLELAADLSRAGKWLIVADLHARDARLHALRAMGGREHISGLRLEADVDLALQWAEDRLLEAAGITPPAGRPLTLAETVLGYGLAAEDLAWLQALMTEVRFAPGDYLFRIHDPGDALYVSTQGEISIMMPGQSGRRLASLAPGVVVGEMALLEDIHRSADALAATELVALRLSRDAFDAMRRERPALSDKVIRNLAVHISARLRNATAELAAALEP